MPAPGWLQGGQTLARNARVRTNTDGDGTHGAAVGALREEKGVRQGRGERPSLWDRQPQPSEDSMALKATCPRTFGQRVGQETAWTLPSCFTGVKGCILLTVSSKNSKMLTTVSQKALISENTKG